MCGRARRDQAHEVVGVDGLEELRLRAAHERQRAARGGEDRDRVDPGELLPEMRIEAERPARLALVVDDLARRAPRDVVEDEEVVAGLRRHRGGSARRSPPANAGRGAPGSAAAATGGRMFCGAKKGGSTITAPSSSGAEVARKAHRHASAERMADDDRRPAVERAAGAPRLARLAHELLEDISARASPSAPCR